MSKPVVSNQRINWALFQACELPQSLCVGEERTLSAEQTEEINRHLIQIEEHVARVRILFATAKERF